MGVAAAAILHLGSGTRVVAVTVVVNPKGSFDVVVIVALIIGQAYFIEEMDTEIIISNTARTREAMVPPFIVTIFSPGLNLSMRRITEIVFREHGVPLPTDTADAPITPTTAEYLLKAGASEEECWAAIEALVGREIADGLRKLAEEYRAGRISREELEERARALFQ